MSSQNHNMLLNLQISQLFKPAYRDLLREYAGEIAPPCVAEALMKFLSRTN